MFNFFWKSKEEIEILKQEAFDNSAEEIKFVEKYLWNDKIIEIFADTRVNLWLYSYRDANIYEIFFKLVPWTWYTSDLDKSNIQSLEYLYSEINDDIDDHNRIKKMEWLWYKMLSKSYDGKTYFSLLSPNGSKESWTRKEIDNL